MSAIKGRDPLKPGSPAWDARQSRHRHNGLLGDVRRAILAMNYVQQLPTTSRKAKDIAQEINVLLMALDQDLRANRLDPQ